MRKGSLYYEWTTNHPNPVVVFVFSLVNFRWGFHQFKGRAVSAQTLNNEESNPYKSWVTEPENGNGT